MTNSVKKKSGIFLMVLCVCLGLFVPDVTVQAASGKTSVSVSSGTVDIGDTVTVTTKAAGPSGEGAVAIMAVSYDPGVLEYVSCSTTAGGGGGSVRATGDSVTFTFKAISAGTSAISVSGSDGRIFETNAELDSMEGSSASVTVNNAAGGAGSTGGKEDNGNSGGKEEDGSSDGKTGGGNTSGGDAGSTGGNTNGGNTGGEEKKPLSADNSLKSLSISPGSLSPAFSGKTLKYSAAVEHDVTSIAVSATPANAKAVVESVSGSSSLNVGSNTVKIVVKAENGVTATYSIHVTRKAEGTQTADPEKPEEKPEEEPGAETGNAAETVMAGGTACRISEDFTEEDIPAGFAEASISYHGNDYRGVSFNQGAPKLLWLVPENTEAASGAFYVYDETRDTVYPFVRMSHGENYVIALLPPVDFTMQENYVQTSFSAEGRDGITGYQVMTEETEIETGFYLFYAVNQEGTEGWYQYDTLEGTYQRLAAHATDKTASGVDMEYLQKEYTALSEKYAKERSFARTVIGILAFVIAVLIVVIVNLLLYRFRRNGHDDDFPDGDSMGDDFSDDDSGENLTEKIFWEDDFLKADFMDEESAREDFPKDDFMDEDFMDDEAKEKRLVTDGKPKERAWRRNFSKSVRDELGKEAVPEEQIQVKMPADLAGAEEAEKRRRARTLFFAEEAPVENEKEPAAEKKGNMKNKDDLEVIDFNDL